MHGVDHIMANLTTHVRLFEERFVNNSICYKGTQSIMRKYEAPTTCEANYRERHGHCFRHYQCDCEDELSAKDVRKCGGMHDGADRRKCRDSKTSTECEAIKYEGYQSCKWDYQYQSASLLEFQQSGQARSLLSSRSLERSLQLKSGRRRAPAPPPTPRPTPAPEMAPPAKCADGTRQQKCYLDCPSDYIAEGTDKCKPKCPADFPAEGKIGLISSPGCGISGEVLASALGTQINKIGDSLIKTVTFVFKALKDGDTIEQSDVQSLLDSGLALAREFIYPDCKYQTA